MRPVESLSPSDTFLYRGCTKCLLSLRFTHRSGYAGWGRAKSIFLALSRALSGTLALNSSGRRLLGVTATVAAALEGRRQCFASLKWRSTNRGKPSRHLRRSPRIGRVLNGLYMWQTAKPRENNSAACEKIRGGETHGR